MVSQRTKDIAKYHKSSQISDKFTVFVVLRAPIFCRYQRLVCEIWGYLRSAGANTGFNMAFKSVTKANRNTLASKLGINDAAHIANGL
jgi:hypothetical protein